MPDIREALADLLAGHRSEASMNWVSCSCGVPHWERFAGYAAHLAEVIETDHLVVPRSDIVTEYGVEFRGMNFGGHRSADVARFRARTMYGLGEDAARERETWAGPWSPIPLPEGGA